MAPGVFSSFGMLFSDLRYDFVRTSLMRLDEASFERIEKVYRELEAQGRKAIAGTSVKPQRIEVRRAADMRYVGQEHPVTVDLPMSVFKRRDRKAIKRLFDEMHEQRYGTSAPAESAEIVSLRATVAGVMRKAAAVEDRARTRAPTEGGFFRQAACAFRRCVPADADVSACGACRLQPHQRAGADRGARLDHGADAGRRLRGGCVGQFGDYGW